MNSAEIAELFAKERYAGTLRDDGIPFLEHLRGMVTRLKSLGVSDKEVISAAWLYGIINETKTSFDEIENRFGSRVAVLVLALSRDRNVPRDQVERQYVKQLKEAPIEVKLVKLCDISTSIKSLKDCAWSRTKKSKRVKKELYYLTLMKQELTRALSQYPAIRNIIVGINETAITYGQKPILL